MNAKRIISLNALKIERVNRTETGAVVSGYACHFGKANGNGEIVDEKSFEGFFSQLKDGGLMPAFNFQHDNSLIIGGWDDIAADAEGLHVVGHLNTSSKYVADNILPLVEAGDVTHLSTQGFSYFDDWEEREDGFYIKNFYLTAIALVALPADFGAKAELRNDYRAWKAEQPKPEPPQKPIIIY